MDGSALARSKALAGGPQKSYSIYWRKNRSHHEATELASVLSALRKVAGLIGDNTKPVYWDGMPCSEKSAIILNPEVVKGTYPVPYRNIDLLVGQVVYESVLNVEWSDWVIEQVKSYVTLSAETEPYLQSILVIAEEIYLDALVQQWVWSFYLSKHLHSLASQKDRRDLSLPPVPESVAGLWREIIFLQATFKSVHHYYEDLLAILMEYTPLIREIANLPILGERRSQRIQLYSDMWAKIQRALLEWEKFEPLKNAVSIKDKSGPKVPTPEAGEDSKNEPGLKDSAPTPEVMRPELAEEINSILDEGQMDLTQVILAVVENPKSEVMNTLFSRGVAECKVAIDKEQVNRLRKIFEKQQSLIRRSRRKRARRGLEQGKLDVRRLYRVPYSEKIFKRKENIHSDQSWIITIVADASASMGRRVGSTSSWILAEQTFASLADAAKRFSNHLEVYSYYEQSGQCHVVKLFKGNKLYTVYPTGQTPSGQAIVAAAMMMAKNRTKRLIIHITDGAANCGLCVADATDYCQKNNIELITIGCGHNEQTREIMKEQYPHSLYLMHDIRGLPAGLERLFREKLLRM
jgi:hypothetical protein